MAFKRSDAPASADSQPVEDNAPLRQATMRQLAQLGYRVLEAEHADAALAMLDRGESPDLLFSDVVMPGSLDGVALARRATAMWRGTASRKGLKVLLTSGFPGVRGADRAVLDCPFPMLNKPYRYDDLARRVREVLDADAVPTSAKGGRFAWAEADSDSDSPADQGERV